jgi:hypothetical protein
LNSDSNQGDSSASFQTSPIRARDSGSRHILADKTGSRITPANSCSRISVGKWNWKPREVSRAIDVIRKAGLAVTGVTISKEGAITVTTGASGTASGQSANPWDTHHAANQERPS